MGLEGGPLSIYKTRSWRQSLEMDRLGADVKFLRAIHTGLEVFLTFCDEAERAATVSLNPLVNRDTEANCFSSLSPTCVCLALELLRLFLGRRKARGSAAE